MSERPQHIVRLVSVRNEREAAVIAATLEQHGIPSRISGQYSSEFRAKAPGLVEVLVAEEDLAHAQEVLAEVRGARDEIDWSQVDVGEPENTSELEVHEGRSYRGIWRRIVQVLVVVILLVAAVRFGRGLLIFFQQITRDLTS